MYNALFSISLFLNIFLNNKFDPYFHITIRYEIFQQQNIRMKNVFFFLFIYEYTNILNSHDQDQCSIYQFNRYDKHKNNVIICFFIFLIGLVIRTNNNITYIDNFIYYYKI